MIQLEKLKRGNEKQKNQKTKFIFPNFLFSRKFNQKNGYFAEKLP